MTTGGRQLRVFVTDGDQRPALAITRSLGRRGISVLVGEERPTSLASSSRYCVRHVTYPSPYRDPHGFRRFLLRFLEQEGVDVVVPVTDVTTYPVSRHADEVQRYTAVAAPPFEAFEALSNKATLAERATAYGIPIPRTHFVDGTRELKEVVDRIEYPAVVKPARSRILTDTGWLSASVQYAHSEADLWRLYQEHEYLAAHPSLIQERIVGAGVGLFALFDRGRLVAPFAHRRLREKPPSGGVSVLRESVALDRDLVEHAIGMLAPLGWNGVVMLEYKRDRRTGTPFLMEVNGRFWGSLQLAIDAGVDFPHLLCRLALGERIEAVPGYRVGVKSRWLLGDLDHLVLRLFKRDRALDLPDSAPSRLRVLAEFLKFHEPGLHYEVIDRDDPRPFRYELSQYGRAIRGTATGFARRVVGRLATSSARVIPSRT